MWWCRKSEPRIASGSAWPLAQLRFVTAQTVATIAVMTSNFFLNKMFTYRDQRLRGWQLTRGLISFFLISCEIFFLTYHLAARVWDNALAPRVAVLLLANYSNRIRFASGSALAPVPIWRWRSSASSASPTTAALASNGKEGNAALMALTNGQESRSCT
jgi:putative flippase GtrA